MRTPAVKVEGGADGSARGGAGGAPGRPGGFGLQNESVDALPTACTTKELAAIVSGVGP